MRRNSFVIIVVGVLALIAVGRIISTYRVTSVAWDEPCHIAAGIEWLDKGTYNMDPIHPPLSRDAIGLPLYLAGERLPVFTDGRGDHDYYDYGTRILYDGGHYFRNLVLARIGVLPFFLLTIVLVFWWTRRMFGPSEGTLAALAAVFLYTTTPSVLAFAGLAYTDTTTACMQFATLFALVTWIQKPTRGSTAVLGIALGLALLSKMTTLLFLPASAVGILLARWTVGAKTPEKSEAQPEKPALEISKSQWLTRLGLALAIAVVVLWGGYKFSVGHVQEDMGLTPQAMPSFQHFPGPVRSLAKRAVVSDWMVPAPMLIKGFTVAWVINKVRMPSYMFGNTTPGGSWYFFFVALAVKAPLALLALWFVGVWAVVRRRDWVPLAPAIAVVMILIVAISIQYKEGVRHLLVVFPLLAMVAGYGASVLWKSTGKWKLASRIAVVVLIAWQGVASLSAGRDFISYYNELAARDPSKIYFTGCDLDCGQDVYRLAEEARRRNISYLAIAVWSSADIYQMGLPKLEILEPNRPVTGWVAISIRSLKIAQLFHKQYATDSYAWLNQYKPVAMVGKTIFLYYIPEGAAVPSQGTEPRVQPGTKGP
ncbi:MAG TPA: glycosyltransferase family 39 protein [Terriglobales bacterium]|nr:glycosyltransferase family 39 protein [Terriglobales bacterium]